jgi:D-arabinose 5-phosphate isomerase GutQ
MKFVATCKSLGISSSFMHACEAAHGDLGDVREDDVLLFISYSGKTPELLNLLPHIPLSTRVLALTSRISREDCPLVAGRVDGILLPAPVHALEDDSFGVSAPTTSTTVALAVTDMLALTVADQLHGDTTKQVFKRNHPGGAIGMTHREVEALKEDGINISVLELPSPTISTMDSDGSSRAIP